MKFVEYKLNLVTNALLLQHLFNIQCMNSSFSMTICSYKEYLFPILVAQVGISILHSLVNNDIFLKKWQQKSDKSFNF